MPFAKRAAALAPRSGSVLDTCAWIEHLLGNHAVAAKILADAIKLDPGASEIRLHAAAVAVALGDRARAENELKEALRLNPGLAQREETRRLRERIESLPAQDRKPVSEFRYFISRRSQPAASKPKPSIIDADPPSGTEAAKVPARKTGSG